MAFPAFGGFLATILFLMQGGFGASRGPFDFIIGFLILPSVLLLLPVIDLLSLPNVPADYEFPLVIGIPTLMNLGLFALAGFVSWKLFPSRRTEVRAEELLNHLSRTGWSIQDTRSSAFWIVTGVKDEKIIRGEGGSRAEAFRHVYEQAAAVDVRTKMKQSPSTNFLHAILFMILGHSFEAVSGWFLLMMYGIASINGPGLQGMQQLSRTLVKMLDPRDGLWGTLFLLLGTVGGLLLLFMGCFRLTQAIGQEVPTNNAATQERPSVP